MKKVCIFLLLPFLFTQCMKEDTPLSKTDILTVTPYKIVSEKINNKPVTVRECEKDNYLSFDKNGTVKIIDNQNRCTGDVSGTWKFIDNETKIEFIFFNAIYHQKIIRLDSDFLILLDETTDKNNITETTYTNKY